MAPIFHNLVYISFKKIVISESSFGILNKAILIVNLKLLTAENI